MPNTQQLKLELEESEALKLITQSLSEVAALEFKRTKNRIQHNKFFFRDISKIYSTLQVLAERRRLMSKIKSIKNGKTISILLTSNYHLYGGVDNELSHFFHQATSKFTTERLIIGSTGISYMRAFDRSGFFKTLVLHSDLPNGAEINAIVERIKNYSQMLVFYSKFITILNQQVDVETVSLEKPNMDSKNYNLNYILEPELPQMMSFFEGQILASILNSFFLQAKLSRTAARMIRMDEAEINAGKLINKERMNLFQNKRKLQNLRVLEVFPVIMELINEK